ncbi:2-amino-4-hydroxy-6-hydroxymethyldihydropteridine diphosphokinase [Tautonia marina]|uniref:2-amino-4-hydroxy-6- hydroxymethyldihydropteridine diphosphokinase n=1 Tax=Tautonia marina TaxID=2653855 RepID=UPI001260C9A2|nr:2-amino-4-hydroxy-6-hydroxymethyldihydropteridine diphosphokinase [Tautonia marina]
MGTTLASIALGSNLGHRSEILDQAIAELAQSREVVIRGVSRYLETPPVGGPGGQGAFLNAAAALETTLDPFALHRLLIEVEHHAGRVREVRWDARTLDLDLILFGDQIIETPELIVPHPRFAVRRFVLSPLAEVGAEAVDPVTRRSVRELLANLDRRPSYVAIDRISAPGLGLDVALNLLDQLPGAEFIPEFSLHPNHQADSSPIQLLDGIAESTNALIAAADQMKRSSRDSWLVSSFDLEREVSALRKWLQSELAARIGFEDGPNGGFVDRLDSVLRMVRDAPTPTFVVSINDDRSVADLARNGRPLPLLRPEVGRPEEIASEIRAACEASRAGFGA